MSKKRLIQEGEVLCQMFFDWKKWIGSIDCQTILPFLWYSYFGRWKDVR